MSRVWRATPAPRTNGTGSGSPSGGLAYVGIRLAVYIASLAPIVLIYSTKGRGIFIAPPIVLIGAVATWLFLREAALSQRRRMLYGIGVGLIMGELTWALGWWTVAPVVGGAAIWLVFYVASGIAEHGASGSLARSVLLEYAGVGLIGLLVVLATQPWRP